MDSNSMAISKHSLSINLTDDAQEVLDAAAASRGCTVEQMVEGILQILGDDPDLLDNVIDDRDPE
jgi:uncharacterized protein (DUF1778 family)